MKEFLSGNSKISTEINQVLDNLYNVELPNLDWNNPNIEEINKVNQELFNSKEIIKKFSSYKYKGKQAIRKVIEIENYKESFFSNLVNLHTNKSNKLSGLELAIEDNSNNLGMLKKLRIEANQVDDIISGEDGIQKILNIERHSYNYKRKRIDKIDSKLDQIVEKYKLFDTASNKQKELKDIKKSLKGKLIQTNLEFDCHNNKYFEGLIFINNFANEIETFIDKPYELINYKNNLIKSTNQIQELITITNKQEYSSKDLDSLKDGFKIINKKIVPRIFFEKELTTYNEKSSEFKFKAENILKKEEQKAKQELTNLKNIRAQIEKEVSEKKYHELETGLDSLNTKVRATGSLLNDRINASFEETDRRRVNQTRELKENIGQNKNSIDNLSSDVNEQYANIQSTLDSYKETLTSVSEELSSLKNKFESLGMEKKSIEDEVYKTKHEIEEIKNYKLELTDKIESGSSQKYFSLPVYILSLSYPDNFRLFTARRILAGDNGEKNWSERFDNLDYEVKDLNVTSQNDYEYFNKIALGIKKAIDNPEPFFNTDKAQETYNLLSEKINKFAA